MPPKVLRHDDSVIFAAFSPDDRYVATCGRDRTARIWEVDTGRLVGIPLMHTGWVYHACFSPDGRRLVTSCTDGAARVWEFGGGTQPVWSRFMGQGFQHL